MDGDLEMQVEPASSGPKMCTPLPSFYLTHFSHPPPHLTPAPFCMTLTYLAKRQRQNLAKMQARKLAKEQSKMVTVEQQAVAAERRGMTIQEYRGQRPEGQKVNVKSQKRRMRKERERLRKKVEQGEAMDLE